MLVVDSHVHLGLHWYEPAETLLDEMARCGVDKAVLVHGVTTSDNGYELECVRKYRGRFGAVVLVDGQDAAAAGKMKKLASNGAIGVRLWADKLFPGPDPLAVWRAASELGLPVSCAGRLEAFASAGFRNLVRELPDLKIVVEHLGKGAKPEMSEDLFSRVLELASYPNVYIKLPGLGELLPRPKRTATDSEVFTQSPPALRMAYEAFGPRRMMWGSDFPRCCGREGYANALRLPMEKTPFFTAEDKEWIFGKTALSVWSIE